MVTTCLIVKWLEILTSFETVLSCVVFGHIKQILWTKSGYFGNPVPKIYFVDMGEADLSSSLQC